jgi:hypothetical protein
VHRAEAQAVRERADAQQDQGDAPQAGRGQREAQAGDERGDQIERGGQLVNLHDHDRTLSFFGLDRAQP